MRLKSYVTLVLATSFLAGGTNKINEVCDLEDWRGMWYKVAFRTAGFFSTPTLLTYIFSKLVFTDSNLNFTNVYEARYRNYLSLDNEKFVIKVSHLSVTQIPKVHLLPLDPKKQYVMEFNGNIEDIILNIDLDVEKERIVQNIPYWQKILTFLYYLFTRKIFNSDDETDIWDVFENERKIIEKLSFRIHIPNSKLKVDLLAKVYKCNSLYSKICVGSYNILKIMLSYLVPISKFQKDTQEKNVFWTAFDNLKFENIVYDFDGFTEISLRDKKDKDFPERITDSILKSWEYMLRQDNNFLKNYIRNKVVNVLEYTLNKQLTYLNHGPFPEKC